MVCCDVQKIREDDLTLINITNSEYLILNAAHVYLVCQNSSDKI